MTSLKSKSLRRVFTKTPGGKSVMRRKPKTGSVPVCPTTGQKLNGIPKMRSAEMKRMPKSKKTVSRMFGGMLSSWASRRKIIEKVR